jgi:glycosyltransferase involved in cell wall biosynthesis
VSRTIHMICLRNPWPADTGGARDMLERLKSLHQHGVQVYLHVFDRAENSLIEALKPFCKEIYVYNRKLSVRRLLRGQPYIVACRADKTLLTRLQQDNLPILFDGIHTTAFLSDLMKGNRKMAVRMHNDEVNYYRSLAKFESNPFKRIYFLWEALQLHRWMKQLPKDLPLGCVQSEERDTLQDHYGFSDVFILPPPIPGSVDIHTGSGGYCLYHGNLSIGENERAVVWLLRRVFAKIKLPLVIAGKSPSRKLEKLIHFYQHACLVANPSQDELKDLIQKAQVHVLPSMTRTGIKQKVFDALQFGRHCLINTNMRHASPWTDACEVANSSSEMADRVKRLFSMPFTADMIEARRKRLSNWRKQLDPVEEVIKRLY